MSLRPKTYLYSCSNEMEIYLSYNSSRDNGDALLSWSVVSDSATPWTVAHQLPLVCGDFPGKNTGVGCHALLQGIFPI